MKRPIDAAARLARALDRRASREPDTLRREPETRVGGSAWSGIGPVFRSPFLRKIALWLVLMTFASTILYFVQAHLVGEAFTDRAMRRLSAAAIALVAAPLAGLWVVIGLQLGRAEERARSRGAIAPAADP